MTPRRWPLSLALVEGHVGHRSFVRELSAEVFSRFGDYERSLPSLLGAAGISTVVAESAGRPVGFAMYTRDESAAELLAIAVAPLRQGCGLGRRLLEHVERRVRNEASRARGATLCLTVAVDNELARRLFDAAGYGVVDGCEGLYPGGQQSIEMEKLLE